MRRFANLIFGLATVSACGVGFADFVKAPADYFKISLQDNKVVVTNLSKESLYVEVPADVEGGHGPFEPKKEGEYYVLASKATFGPSKNVGNFSKIFDVRVSEIPEFMKDLRYGTSLSLVKRLADPDDVHEYIHIDGEGFLRNNTGTTLFIQVGSRVFKVENRGYDKVPYQSIYEEVHGKEAVDTSQFAVYREVSSTSAEDSRLAKVVSASKSGRDSVEPVFPVDLPGELTFYLTDGTFIPQDQWHEFFEISSGEYGSNLYKNNTKDPIRAQYSKREGVVVNTCNNDVASGKTLVVHRDGSYSITGS